MRTITSLTRTTIRPGDSRRPTPNGSRAGVATRRTPNAPAAEAMAPDRTSRMAGRLLRRRSTTRDLRATYRGDGNHPPRGTARLPASRATSGLSRRRSPKRPPARSRRHRGDLRAGGPQDITGLQPDRRRPPSRPRPGSSTRAVAGPGTTIPKRRSSTRNASVSQTRTLSNGWSEIRPANQPTKPP